MQIAPLASSRRLFGKAPLRRTSIDTPPSEDEAENFPRLEDVQPRGLGRVGKGHCNTRAGDIVGEAVKGADETAATHASAHFGAQGGTQVRAYRLGDANGPLIVAPNDDILSEPLLLDQCALQYRSAIGDKVPPLRKRMERENVAPNAKNAFHVRRRILSKQKLLHSKISQSRTLGTLCSTGIAPPFASCRIIMGSKHAVIDSERVTRSIP